MKKIAVIGTGLALLFVGAAFAHPGAPFRLASQARAAFFRPGKGLYDDKSMHCAGIGAHVGRRYQHFYCLSERNDGVRFGQIIHTLPPADGSWTFSDIRIISGTQSAVKVFGTASASGANPTAVAIGTTSKPDHVEIAQYASPDQRITVTWSIVCFNGDRTDTKRGEYVDYSGPSHEITIKPYAQPDTCAVTAYGSITSGTVRLKLIAE